MAILVTGGTGFIGSHTVVQLLSDGRDVVIVDNLCNSKLCVLDRVKTITGKDVKFYKADLLDFDAIDKIFKENDIDSVIHFAGLKAVGESVQKPMLYYHNNITGTLNLTKAMAANGCKRIVFSSSATVYGNPKTVPIKEDFPLSTTNPYGETKLMIERILSDIVKSDPEWSVSILRYFNPIGAHESGLIGEDPKGIPNNLLPYIVKVASGKYDHLSVFGNDYNTKSSICAPIPCSESASSTAVQECLQEIRTTPVLSCGPWATKASLVKTTLQWQTSSTRTTLAPFTIVKQGMRSVLTL